LFGLSGSWISNLLDGLAFLDIDDCLTNQLLTQKYRLANSPAIADLPFFDFMVITEQLVNKLQRVSLNTYMWLGNLRLGLRNLLYKTFAYIL
jgi:hypothetical protein